MILSRPSEDAVCPKCGGPLASRQEHPYPVILQLLFGVSFIVFMVYFEKLREHSLWLWLWSAFQSVLGILLIRGRIRARKRVLRCIRCNADLT